MSMSIRTSVLADDLIAAIAKTSIKPLKALINKKLNDDSFGRTNKFHVRESLDGLLEKFQVVGNDGLADALHQRLEELDQRHLNLAPEILSLLLLLSDNPATLVDPIVVDKCLTHKEPESLTWADIDGPESNEPEGLWDDIDYAAESSDDDISLASSDVSIPKIVPHSSTVPLDEFNLPDDLFLEEEDNALLISITQCQSLAESGDRNNSYLTEQQTIKDTISMLQGLPTTIFKVKEDNIVIVSQEFLMRHTSRQAFQAILNSFSHMGTATQVLRLFVNRPQAVPLMQTFQKELEALVSSFDKYLSEEQSYYLHLSTPLVVSLLDLFEKVHKRVQVLLELSNVVQKLDENPNHRSIRCLDLLYDLVCTKQAIGEDSQYRDISKLFFACFENYIKPIRRWMETGELETIQTSTFFVTASTSTREDLQTLWHDWFTLHQESGRLYAPKFLHPASKRVFTTGKSLVFLRHLGVDSIKSSLIDTPTLNYEDICPPDQSLSLFPFAGRLDSAFNQLVDINHKAASSVLKSELDEKCSLWQALEALEYLYLGKDYSRYSVTDHRVFDLIDRGSQSWNNRFLITELLRQAFSSLSCIDVTRLIGRSAKVPPHIFESHNRSVKILKVISIDYTLPWPVANIVTNDLINIYKRISLLLMQIRRGKYTLEKRWFTKPHLSLRESEERDDHVLSFCVRHRLLWFLNVLYHHFTELIIASSARRMLKAAKESADVDAMIEIHHSYVKSLEVQCLLSESLAPLHRTLIALLDLCIFFSDLQVARTLQYCQDQNDQTLSTIRLAKFGVRTSDDSDSDESDIEMSMFEAGNATTFSFRDESYHGQVLHVKSKFDNLCDALKAGLRTDHGVYSQSMEILADSLQCDR